MSGVGIQKDPAGTGLEGKASPGRHMAKTKCLFCLSVTPCSSENTGHPECEFQIPVSTKRDLTDPDQHERYDFRSQNKDVPKDHVEACTNGLLLSKCGAVRMGKSKEIPWERMGRQALLVKWHQLTKRRALK